MTFSSQTLTLYEFFALVVSALGFVAVAISLIFLMKQTAAAALQSKYVADSLSSSNYAALSTMMFGVHQAFVDYPEIRPYFYDGKCIDEGSPDYVRSLAVAAHMLNYFSYIAILSDRYSRLWPPDWWAGYMEAMFASSPVMRRYLRKTRYLYHPRLYDLMLEVESQLERPSPQTGSPTRNGANVDAHSDAHTEVMTYKEERR